MSVSTHTWTPRAEPRIASANASSQLSVNDIDVRAEHFGESHQVMHAFGLDRRRPAPVMVFRTGFAFGQQVASAIRRIKSAFSQCAVVMTPSCLARRSVLNSSSSVTPSAPL